MTTPRDLLLGADGPDVRVPGRVARRLAGPLSDLLRQARDRGEQVDEEVVATIRAIDLAGQAYAEGRVKASLSTSANGHGQRPEADMAAHSAGHAGITIAEAAHRLDVSERHARRLAAEGRFGGRRVGSTYLVDPVLVGEYIRTK